MISKEDIGTFNITFKTTNEGYAYILNWLQSHTEVISDKVIEDTKELYDNDMYFRSLVKMEKKARSNKLDYILKHTK
jgi:hypothetical protein